jgi:putative Holliday junction resolvase
MGRIICLDIGEKRIGVAVSDPLFITAQGIETYNRINEEEDVRCLTQKIRQWDADRLLVGLPLNMNGSKGPQAQKVEEFAEMLGQAAGLYPEYWDERLTTKSAERILIAADVSRAKRKKVIDKMAAVQILQSFLQTL